MTALSTGILKAIARFVLTLRYFPLEEGASNARVYFRGMDRLMLEGRRVSADDADIADESVWTRGKASVGKSFECLQHLKHTQRVLAALFVRPQINCGLRRKSPLNVG